MQPLTALVGALAGKISIVPPVTPRKPLGWGLLLISALGLPNFKESARGLSVRSWGSWGPRPRRRFRLTRVDLHRGLPPAPDCAHPRRWVRPTRVLPREDVYSILPALPFLRPGLCGQGARGPHRVRRHASYFPSQNTPAVRGGDGHQFRAFEKSTSYGDARTRNWLTVPSHHPVSPFATESS